jgi:hypothetical protein
MTSWILVSNFLEYVKLTKLAMVQIVGNVEDERCSKLCNRFTSYLPLVLCVFAQQFYILQIF